MTTMFATCHTEGCENGLQPIEIPNDPDLVLCGPCGQPITDLTTTPPELPTEVPEWLG